MLFIRDIFRWSLPLFWLGIACAAFLTFHLLGARIDADGFLHEPFALLPIGWATLLLAAVSGFINLIWKA